MDSILQYLLDSKDETERVRLRDELILVQAAPLVRKILFENLGFYISRAGKNPNNPHAEDLYQDIRLLMLQRLDNLITNPDIYPIKNYRNLVITIAVNACNNYLRTKSPSRARLKKSLRYLLLHHPDFKSWEGKNRKQICGFSVWMGMSNSPAASERINQLLENPEPFQNDIFRGEDIQGLSLSRLVAGIFTWLNGPIETETLTELLVTLQKIEEQPVESIEASQERPGQKFIDSSTPNDLRIQSKEILRKLWDEVIRLPPEQRDAICLSPPAEIGNDLWEILVTADAVTLPQIAADLGLSIEQLIDLWEQVPMDSLTLAKHLGTTRSQVNKLRFRAMKRLRVRMAEQK